MNNQAPRFCSACRVTRPVDGGEWRTFANGLKRRWVCHVCKARAKENKEKEREQVRNAVLREVPDQRYTD